jgi:hypothetical protein
MSCRKAAIAMLTVQLACSEPAPARIYNTCNSNKECYGGSQCDQEHPELCAVCDPTLGMCVHEMPVAPYPVRILVSRLPRGKNLVDRFAFPPEELRAGVHDLRVPQGKRILGKVLGQLGAQTDAPVGPINAEVAFTPRVDETENQRVEAFVTESSRYMDQSDNNLVADLAVDTIYDVRIIPLGRASEFSPPRSLLLDTAVQDPSLSVDSSGLSTLRGVLTDEAGRQVESGTSVRLIDQGSREVVSVTGSVSNEGSFALRALTSVFDSRQYILQINLDRQKPWQTTIELDPTRINPAEEVTVTIPVVPKRVPFKGRIARGDTGVAAELTFTSSFPRPQNTAGDLHDRDWCGTSVPEDNRPKIKACKTTVRTVTDAAGRFAVDLLPGDYTLHVSPGNDPSGPDGAKAALFEKVVIETQPDGGPQQGQDFAVQDNTRYSAYVRNQRGEPLAGVLVRAVALRRVVDLTKVAAINRSAESVTDENGRFELGLDEGYYDLVARAGDGFPWVYVTNLKITASSDNIDVNGFVIPAPVVLQGTVRNAGIEAGNVAIDAYGEVPSIGGKKRLVLLGTAISENEPGRVGHYTLTLPPEIFDVTAPAP